jgi:predicted ester cyclase
MSTAEENKAVYRRFIETLFNEGRLERLGELVDPDYVFHDAPPGTPQGPDAIREVVTMFRAAFPDLKITIEDQVAEGDKVCSRATTRGTHRGPIFGIAPTGRAIAMSGLTLVRIAGGRVAESWVKNDVAGLLTQLRGAGSG